MNLSTLRPALLTLLGCSSVGSAMAQVQNSNINHRMVISETWADCTDGAESGLEEATLIVEPEFNGVVEAQSCLAWEVDVMGYGGSFNDLVLLDHYDVPENSWAYVYISGWEWDSFGGQCTYDSDFDDCYFVGYGEFNNGSQALDIISGGNGKPNIWDLSVGFNGTNNLIGYQTQWGLYVRSIWSYVHGRTSTDPLEFGPLAPGQTRQHGNSNRLSPYSYGAGADFGTDGGSTYYRFSISDRSSCAFSTSASSGFDVVLTLKDQFGSVIQAQDGSGSGGGEYFNRDLCAGTYIIEVSGYNGSVGDFVVSVTDNQTLGGANVDVQIVDHATCGQANGTAEAVIVSGAFAFPATYGWYDDNLNPVGSGQSVSGLAGGYYALNISDQCGLIESITFSMPTDPDVVAPIAICNSVLTLDVPDWGGPISITAEQVDNGSNDNCGGILDYELSELVFDAADEGPNPVTLTVTDAAGNASTCSCTVNVNVVTGVDDDLQGRPISTYPNPSDGVFTLDLGTMTVTGSDRAWITDLSGRTVHVQRVQSGVNAFDVRYLAKGMYSLELQVGEARASSRILIR